ncbi:methionyl-tRNA formyltransferase [Demequina sp. B12]|uniref:methionyl-tRNA formyltransferase n=1 Tax=Demequina sp. B12 TaxID=2992757 RepID=UPI00237BAF26|nr:methionyl-tRNA formyltransferase [Demequina sp. B12]MDE0573067.1 methionyl-tRNA formyltransferase [Demequina sp. B12]
MRVIFAGTPDVAVPSLEALVASPHEVVAVITQPDARGRRGKTLHPSPVKVAAEAHGLPVFTPVDAKDPAFIADIAALDADCAAVVAYGQILKEDLLGAVRTGWINLHFSLLPTWRGAAPVQRSIMAGDEFTGASTFVLEKGLDTGPVIGTLTERIRPTDTAGELLDRLAHAGAPLLVNSVDALTSGQAAPVAQTEDGVSYAAKLTRDDAYVQWERPSHFVDRQIRGCTPAPGAWTTLPDGSVAKLGPVVQVADAAATVPGQLRWDDGKVLVGTGTSPVALSTIAPAGKKPMDAAAWWRGARLPEGSALGEA